MAKVEILPETFNTDIENQKIAYINQRKALYSKVRDEAILEINNVAKAFINYNKGFENHNESLMRAGAELLSLKMYGFELLSDAQIESKRSMLEQNLEGIERPDGLPEDLEGDIDKISRVICNEARPLTKRVEIHCDAIHKDLNRIDRAKIDLLWAALKIIVCVPVFFLAINAAAASPTFPIIAFVLSVISLKTALLSLCTLKEKNNHIKWDLEDIVKQKRILKNLKPLEKLDEIRKKLQFPEFETKNPYPETPPPPALRLPQETLDPLNWFAATTPGAS